MSLPSTLLHHPRLLLLLAVVLPLAACGTQRVGAGADGSRPAHGQYVASSASVDGHDQAFVAGSQVVLTVDGSRLMLNAGCNTMSGDATWSATSLKVGPMAGTEMGCPEPLMTQDAWLAKLFTGTLDLTRDGDSFTLRQGANQISFAPAPAAPQAALVGTHWVLDSMGTGGNDGAVSSVPVGVTAWLQLDGSGADLKLSLSPGCNSAGGTAHLSGNTLTVRALSATEMACGDPRDQVEGQLLAFFGGPVTVAIDGQMLTLTAKDGRFLTWRAGETTATPPPVGDYVSSGAPSPPFPQGGQIHLSLDGRSVTFSGGCNVMQAPAELADGVLKLTGKIVNLTTRPCSSALAEQDSWLRDFFSSTPSFKVDGNDLRLRSGGTTIWFAPPDPGTGTTEPDASLEGVTFVLTGIGTYSSDSGSMSSVPSGVRASLLLADGRAQVTTGCNSGGAQYRVSGNSLRVGPLMLTKMACRDQGARDVEQAVVKMLSSGRLTWTITGSELRLRSRGHELLFTAQ